ncbi:SphA family protein [Rivibacter subsaxonicus]|uniref:Phenol degradation protein meta n=1 Tax=Rivibacter subsaxonicus TaxID=457575 RepID=A0A4Q7VZR5_9BURK|nr:transporter [Rivibacter subsaxonicus]RZU02422.1 hypothetical protein EV670_0445 [Rivibacter subsaxonicus]
MTGRRLASTISTHRLRGLVAVLPLIAALLFAPRPAAADESGVSFWLPGQFSSFAAVPGDPGWSLPVVYFHSSTEAGRGRSFPVGGRITAGLDVTADLLFLAPGYVFEAPLAGGRASLGITGLFGRVKVGVDATLTGPGGNTVTGSQSDSLTSVGDLYPVASLRWNDGNHNYLAYTMAGVPVGSYEVGRLANLGTNHWSLDAGGGYTYLDPKKGHEFSAVLGFTYNWENSDTQYQNGTSAHLDWAASQFLSEQIHVGLAGYFYYQITGDSGAGAVLGDFKSRVSGIGPQVGYFFPMGGHKAYVNLRGYYEFDARNRPEGWNVWLTLAIPLGSAKP